MSKILVVYYSRSGFTRKVAEAIAAACNADLEEIRDLGSRGGFWGYLHSVREALSRKPAPIVAPARDPSGYDLIVLGTPVWTGKVSSPMRAYVAKLGVSFKAIAVFCTLGGSGADKTLHELAALCGKTAVASLALTDGAIAKGKYDAPIQDFVKTIRDGLGAAPGERAPLSRV